jgi:hypothetical protein
MHNFGLCLISNRQWRGKKPLRRHAMCIGEWSGSNPRSCDTDPQKFGMDTIPGSALWPTAVVQGRKILHFFLYILVKKNKTNFEMLGLELKFAI